MWLWNNTSFKRFVSLFSLVSIFTIVFSLSSSAQSKPVTIDTKQNARLDALEKRLDEQTPSPIINKQLLDNTKESNIINVVIDWIFRGLVIIIVLFLLYQNLMIRITKTGTKKIFSINSDAEVRNTIKGLDTGKISPNLEQRFKKEGYSLSPSKVEISVQSQGKGWLLNDDQKKYSIRKVKDKLDIYKEARGPEQIIREKLLKLERDIGEIDGKINEISKKQVEIENRQNQPGEQIETLSNRIGEIESKYKNLKQENSVSEGNQNLLLQLTSLVNTINGSLQKTTNIETTVKEISSDIKTIASDTKNAIIKLTTNRDSSPSSFDKITRAVNREGISETPDSGTKELRVFGNQKSQVEETKITSEAYKTWEPFITFINENYKGTPLTPLANRTKEQIDSALSKGNDPAETREGFYTFANWIEIIYRNQGNIVFDQFITRFKKQLKAEIYGLDIKGKQFKDAGFETVPFSYDKLNEREKKLCKDILDKNAGTLQPENIVMVISPGVKSICDPKWVVTPKVILYQDIRITG